MMRLFALLFVGLSFGGTLEPAIDWDQLFDIVDIGVFPKNYIYFMELLGDLTSEWENTFTTTPSIPQTSSGRSSSKRPVDSPEMSVKRRKYTLENCANASDELRCVVILLMISSRQPANDEKLMERVHAHCPHASLVNVQAIQHDLRLYTVEPLEFHELLLQNRRPEVFIGKLEGDFVKHIRVWSFFCIQKLELFTKNGSIGWKPCVVHFSSKTARLSHNAMNQYLHEELDALF